MDILTPLSVVVLDNGIAFFDDLSASPTGGCKFSISSADSSSAPSDENSHYSDDDDLPLACRREGSVLTVTDPPVGAKIYVKWDQINWKGWFKGTVIAISWLSCPAAFIRS